MCLGRVLYGGGRWQVQACFCLSCGLLLTFFSFACLFRVCFWIVEAFEWWACQFKSLSVNPSLEVRCLSFAAGHKINPLFEILQVSLISSIKPSRASTIPMPTVYGPYTDPIPTLARLACVFLGCCGSSCSYYPTLLARGPECCLPGGLGS